MKILVISLLALVTFAHTNEDVIDLENNTAWDYARRIGIPLADKIRAIESEQPVSRIVGGNNATLGQISYQVGLLLDFAIGQGVCGGVIVNTWRILTAAHCWWDGANQASNVTAVAGTVTLFSGGQRTTTNNVVMHPDWNPQWISNDVAVVRLPSHLSFSPSVSAIALPWSENLRNETFVNSTAIASGFGRTADGAPVTIWQVLGYVHVQVISNEECSWTFPAHVRPSNICTSGAGGRNVCGADSGGPLAVTWNGRPMLIGLVSFGSAGGCQNGAPAAYARTSYYMNWIGPLLS